MVSRMMLIATVILIIWTQSRAIFCVLGDDHHDIVDTEDTDNRDGSDNHDIDDDVDYKDDRRGDGDGVQWNTFDPNISGAFRRLHAPPSQISNTAKILSHLFQSPSSSSSLLLKLSDAANYFLLLFQF